MVSRENPYQAPQHSGTPPNLSEIRNENAKRLNIIGSVVTLLSAVDMVVTGMVVEHHQEVAQKLNMDPADVANLAIKGFGAGALGLAAGLILEGIVVLLSRSKK